MIGGEYGIIYSISRLVMKRLMHILELFCFYLKLDIGMHEDTDIKRTVLCGYPLLIHIKPLLCGSFLQLDTVELYAPDLVQTLDHDVLKFSGTLGIERKSAVVHGE